MGDETTLLPCPFCGGNNVVASYHSPFIVCEDCGAFGPGSADSTHDEAIAAWNTRATHGTLTAEQVRETVEKHWHDLPDEYDMPEATALPEFSYDWQAIADELNAELGDGKAKYLLLRTFGLAQMMYDCWLEECKAGDNVDMSACNAYSYEFDQVAQVMFDMGIDPNGSDYYRSAELGSGTCELREASWDDGTCTWGVICSACGAKHEHTYGYAWNFCPSCGKRIRKTVEQ